VALSRGGSLIVAVVAAAVALAAVVGFVLVTASSRPQSGSPAARGEVIFQTGRDASGRVIPRTGTGGMMGGGMMGGGCASCHGADGRGRSTAYFTSPDITYGNLTDRQGMVEPDGARGPTYTDAMLKTAVTTGVDPEGGRLEAPMPQWQLTGAEWSDLLAYLKTLP
jgi:hypothetical protein